MTVDFATYRLDLIKADRAFYNDQMCEKMYPNLLRHLKQLEAIFKSLWNQFCDFCRKAFSEGNIIVEIDKNPLKNVKTLDDLLAFAGGG